jgi:GNAT superfamily N-acetyltransferase
MIPHVLRRREVADDPWIFSAWLRQLRREPQNDLVTNERLFAGAHRRIAWLLDHGETLVAADAAYPDSLLGFVCHNLQAVHWIYVKSILHRIGLGSELLSAVRPRELRDGAPIVCSHASATVFGIRAPLRAATTRRRLVYDPYVLDEIMRGAN